MRKNLLFLLVFCFMDVRFSAAADVNLVQLRGHVVAVLNTTPPAVVISNRAHGVQQRLIAVCNAGTNCLQKQATDSNKPVLLGDCAYVYTGVPGAGTPYFWTCTEDEEGLCVNAEGWLRDDGISLYVSLWGVGAGTTCAAPL